MPARKTCRLPGPMRSTRKINCVPLVPIRMYTSNFSQFKGSLSSLSCTHSRDLLLSRKLRLVFLEDEFRRLETFNITCFAVAIGLRFLMHGKGAQNSHIDQNDFLSGLFESHLGKYERTNLRFNDIPFMKNLQSAGIHTVHPK